MSNLSTLMATQAEACRKALLEVCQTAAFAALHPLRDIIEKMVLHVGWPAKSALAGARKRADIVDQPFDIITPDMTGDPKAPPITILNPRLPAEHFNATVLAALVANAAVIRYSTHSFVGADLTAPTEAPTARECQGGGWEYTMNEATKKSSFRRYSPFRNGGPFDQCAEHLKLERHKDVVKVGGDEKTIKVFRFTEVPPAPLSKLATPKWRPVQVNERPPRPFRGYFILWTAAKGEDPVRININSEAGIRAAAKRLGIKDVYTTAYNRTDERVKLFDSFGLNLRLYEKRPKAEASPDASTAKPTASRSLATAKDLVAKVQETLKANAQN